MADDSPKPRPYRQLRLAARLAFWTLFLLWFGRFAYVRWTTPPAVVARQVGRMSAGASVAPNELDAVLNALPPAPVGSSSGGRFGWGPWYQYGDLIQALRGPWSPADSKRQATAAKYVSLVKTRAALDRIVAATQGIRRERVDSEAGERSDPLTLLSAPPGLGHQVATIALCVRARMRHAEKGDAVGALRDLRAALFLCNLIENTKNGAAAFYYQTAVHIPEYELACQAREAVIPPAAAAETIAFLSSELTLSVSAAVREASGIERDLAALLDRYYTDDGNGDGWLVLSAAPGLDGISPTASSGPRSGVWNVFSPLFNGRRVMAAKLAGVHDRAARLDDLDYREAQTALTTRDSRHGRANVLDGPLGTLTSGIDTGEFQRVFWQVVQRRAVVVMLALSAHKHDRGEYPETLSGLTPDYLDEIPLDAYTHQAFKYVRSTDGEYELAPRESISELVELWHLKGFEYPRDSYLPERGEPEDDSNNP